MKNDALKSAIAKRRGHGLDITISVEPSNAKPDSDLAPDPELPEHDGDMDPAALDAKAQPAADPEQEMRDAMMHGMGPQDMQMMKEKSKPSLGERARMAMAQKK